MQSAVDRDLLDKVRTAFFQHKVASQQRVSTYLNECGRLFADKSDVETKFAKNRAET